MITMVVTVVVVTVMITVVAAVVVAPVTPSTPATPPPATPSGDFRVWPTGGGDGIRSHDNECGNQKPCEGNQQTLCLHHDG
ncbi:unnamed protein product [Linum trigynum]|uniref:Secreted protein n=1 Tax=Linum trigynum TaxID=586398 RepID=A0AAV2DWW2_9ROSI